MTPTATRKRPHHIRPAPAAPPAAGSWHTAVVVAAEGRSLRLRVGDAERPARLALGCLVALQPLDHVVAFVQDGQWWATALLDRPDAQALCIDSPTGLALRGPQVTVQAAEALQLQAPQVRLGCEQAEITGERLHLIASGIKAIGGALSTVFDRVQHFSKQHHRTTEGLDRTQAQHMELQAQQLLQVHSEHTMIDGERLVKTRGAQIHFG